MPVHTRDKFVRHGEAIPWINVTHATRITQFWLLLRCNISSVVTSEACLITKNEKNHLSVSWLVTEND